MLVVVPISCCVHAIFHPFALVCSISICRHWFFFMSLIDFHFVLFCRFSISFCDCEEFSFCICYSMLKIFTVLLSFFLSFFLSFSFSITFTVLRCAPSATITYRLPPNTNAQLFIVDNICFSMKIWKHAFTIDRQSMIIKTQMKTFIHVNLDAPRTFTAMNENNFIEFGRKFWQFY